MAREIVRRIGDVNPLDYNGGVIFHDAGAYALEWVEADESETECEGGYYDDEDDWVEEECIQDFEVYQVDVDDDIYDRFDAKTRVEAAKQWGDIKLAFRNDSWLKQSILIQALGEWLGWHQLDEYPVTFERHNLESRWELD